MSPAVVGHLCPLHPMPTEKPTSDDRRVAGVQESDELRAQPREHLEAPVEIRIVSVQFAALSENVSDAGILLATEEPLKVSIEFDGADGRETRIGRIVRLQRMGESSTGIAVEFDPS